MSIDETFPKRYEPKAIEKKWQDAWYGQGAFSQANRFDENSSKPTFSIDTPPPTVSGKLHIGHVFSYTHTEIISRYKRLRGFNVYYPFGYDDNGLPTELLTEKEHGIRAHQTDRRKFRELCLETGKKYSQAFSQLWKSLGFSCDFESAYSTISPTSQKISQWSFVDLYKKGKVERRKEPALWCTKCATSFAQAEIDDIFKAGKFVHIPFEVEGLAPLTVATTRPELLAACVSVFVNPEDERFKSYVGKKAKVPFFGHEVSVIADEKAQIDKGTGVVMCCTFGDTTDIQWWRQYKLPLREAISKYGKMTELCGPVANLKIEEAKEKMIEILKEKNLVLKVVDIPAESRVVNVHERCGTPVEFIVQPQWFIKVCDEKENLISIARKIKWHPEFMRSRYENWVENLSWDWAISRQRAFGVPIPAWYSEDGKHIYVADPKDLPLDPTESKPPVPCPSGEWIADSDVLDTWATSSATPLINARFSLPNERKNFLPMSMRPQAHDIIRTWAFYTIAKSYFHFKDMPWKDIVISGHVQKPGAKVEAAQMAGQDFARKTKISKSKDGETFAPEKIIERNCADAIRLWSAGASLGTDILFDEGGMGESLKFLNKLWNATRFALLNLENFKPEKNFASKYPVDQWILARLSQVMNYYQKSFDQYEIHGAKVELDKFFWIDFCDNYIEFIKWRCLSSDAKVAEEAKQTLYQVLFKLLQLYAPLAPHITEEIYQLYFKQFEKIESIHQTELQFDGVKVDEKFLAGGKYLVGAIGLVRGFKSKNQYGFKIPIEDLKIYTNAEQKPHLEATISDIKNFAQAKSISILDSKEATNTFEQEFEGIKINAYVDPKVVEEFKAAKKPS
ncbi:MAG: valine--tRNA ligase [Deltaproteobacteria bacterium]|nr:valine--tRNA ligase [Deltaproteobacteria bacterium]